MTRISMVRVTDELAELASGWQPCLFIHLSSILSDAFCRKVTRIFPHNIRVSQLASPDLNAVQFLA